MNTINEQFNSTNWCKELIASDKDGQQVPLQAKTACRWCMLGWLYKVYGKLSQVERDKMETTLTGLLPAPFKNIPEFNDHPTTTAEDVKAIFVQAKI